MSCMYAHALVSTNIGMQRSMCICDQTICILSTDDGFQKKKSGDERDCNFEQTVSAISSRLLFPTMLYIIFGLSVGMATM